MKSILEAAVVFAIGAAIVLVHFSLQSGQSIARIIAEVISLI